MEGKFYHTKESANQYIEIAKGYDGSELIEKLNKFLPTSSSLLEIGSGPGVDLEILKSYYNVTGSDFSKVFIELIKTKLPDTPVLHLDAITLKTNQKFDCIYSNKVLHHLKIEELPNSIINQHKILNNNGIACHSFWEGDKTEEMHGLQFNYYTTSKLEKLFNNHFEILLLEKYKEMEKDDSILLVGRKK